MVPCHAASRLAALLTRGTLLPTLVHNVPSDTPVSYFIRLAQLTSSSNEIILAKCNISAVGVGKLFVTLFMKTRL